VGTIADANGRYVLKQVPTSHYLVQVSSVGYASVTRHVDFSITVTSLDFQLASSTNVLADVVVTGFGQTTSKQRVPIPIQVVSHDMFVQQASTNVVDAIAKLPGVTAITTGPGVSKPQINGLGYNRVLTLLDGQRQEDFQWGDEHGLLIDPYAVDNAEIIRGAASLQYGANAMAGVVSFKSQPFVEDGTVKGSVQSEFQTNNGLIGNTIDIGGNKNGLAWDFRTSYEQAHCYQDPHDGYVWGTAFRQSNTRGVIALIRKWGYSRLTVSLLNRQIEIPDGNRDSTSRRFEFDVPIGAQFVNGKYVPGSGQIYPTLKNFLSYQPNISGYQVLAHDEVWWQNSIAVGEGTFNADIGYTQSIRHEIDTGRVGEENMIVHDIPYSFKYQTENDDLSLKLTTGINGIYEFENNYPEPPKPYTGDFEIPNYHIFDMGGFGILEKKYEKLTLSGGLRYDLRSITGQAMYLANYDTHDQAIVPAGTPGAYMQFPQFSHTYTGFSGSIGASYQLAGQNYVKLNIAKSYRAPAINELTSNELDPSNMFKLGDPNLKAEQGYEVDVAYGNNGKDVSFEVDGFFNFIHNFIFSDRLQSKHGGDSIQLGAPVYKYTSNRAIIAGATAYLNLHPSVIRWFELDNGFTYIYTFLPGQTDSTQHVPFTPAPRLTSKARFKLTDKPNSILGSTYVEFGLAKYWAQHDIYGALWNELPSSAYTLFNAGLGTHFVDPRTRKIFCSFYINCTNLMNIAYIDHTSRPQYFWAYNSVENPTNFGATAAIVTKPSQGIFNMGRNVGFKLIVPIGIGRAKPQ